MVLGKLDSYMQNIKLENSVTPYTKINSKWFKDLSVNPESTKLLEENTGSMCSDAGLSNVFSGLSSQSKETEAKIDGTTSN